MTVPGQWTTRSLAVGPIRWSIEAEPTLSPVLDLIFAGVEASSPSSTTATRLSLNVSLSIAATLEQRRDRPRLPNFIAEGDALIDRSQGWDARITASPDGLTAGFQLVDVAAFGAQWAPTLMALNVAAALRVSLGMAAPQAGALLLHSAALCHPEHGAAVFLGQSGDGKTTMTRRLPGWRLLSDDAALVWRDGDAWSVSGTPLPGKEALPRSLSPASLRALVALSPRAQSLSLAPLGLGEASFQIMSRLLWFGAPTDELATLIAGLTTGVPAYRLGSNLEHEVDSPLTAALRARAAQPTTAASALAGVG